ncbi:hypothetical protein B0J13DRAFT_546707 [Dactylonectria estremocensis]|uniref:Uncharacterized protein n=1 Tax=Dactylonectria estremocensis TaxID=1079267 RepID=A0A9P9F221_9HYPO|nr:hypothetical protein B0J13DRAFT_546707 [Dactylonectria estremocensis]
MASLHKKSGGLGFRSSVDSARERLLDPLEHLDQQPKFTLNFSAILLIRLPVIALSIADTVVIAVFCGYHEGWAAFFGCWTTALTLWTIFHVLRGSSRADKFEFQLGNFVCWCGRRDSTGITARQKRPYHIMLVDFVFCSLMIILSVLAFETGIWRDWYDDNAASVGGISITLASLQLALSVLNFFSLFRKAKIVIFASEHEETAGAAFTVGEIYTDDVSEPRTSAASLV